MEIALRGGPALPSVEGLGQQVAQALDFAVREGDLDAIDFAIDQAVKAGVSQEAVDAARKRRRLLDTTVEEVTTKEQRREAAENLRSAVSMGNADMISGALDDAVKSNVKSKVVESASQQLASIRQDTRLQVAHDNALKALLSASPGEDGQKRLIAGVLQAMLAGCSAASIRDAATEAGREKVFAYAVGHILEVSVQGERMSELEHAISWSQEASVSSELLERAYARKVELADEQRQHLRKEEVAQILSEALQGSDVRQLATAVEKARKVGISKSMVRLAQKRLAMLQEASTTIAAETALSNAMSTANADILRSALQRANREGLAPDLLLRAEAKLKLLECAAERQDASRDASQALSAAMAQNDVQVLEAAIENATRVGISRELVSRARRKLARGQAPECSVQQETLSLEP